MTPGIDKGLFFSDGRPGKPVAVKLPAGPDIKNRILHTKCCERLSSFQIMAVIISSGGFIKRCADRDEWDRPQNFSFYFPPQLCCPAHTAVIILPVGMAGITQNTFYRPA
jgi:hypothetical protein